MSSSNKTKPKATSGTASAIVNDDEDFNSFEGTRFYFYLDEKTNRWYISGASDEDHLGQYQYISLWLPNEGDVVKKPTQSLTTMVRRGKPMRHGQKQLPRHFALTPPSAEV